MVIGPRSVDQTGSLDAYKPPQAQRHPPPPPPSFSITPSGKCSTEFDHELHAYMTIHKNMADMLTTGEHG
jgi:hypothetical protein